MGQGTISYDIYAMAYADPAEPLISSDNWGFYQERAREQMARYKRTYTVVDPNAHLANDVYANTLTGEQMAICAMAEALYSFDLIANGEGGAAQSASIGSVSVSYGNTGKQATDVTPAGQSRELYRRASLYLDIYRGVG